MARYYDLILGLIPLALGGITALLTALGFATTTAIPIASLAALGLMGHAMFVNGPVDRGVGGDSRAGTDAHAGGEPGFQSAD